MSIDSLLFVLSHLKAILMFRLEDAGPDTKSALVPVDEDLFFTHLYVHFSEVEKEAEHEILHYQRPLLLFGKQGTGKTSVLEHVLRRLREKLDFTLIKIRCTRDHSASFSSLKGVENLLKERISHELASSDLSIYDLLERVLTEHPSYLRDSASEATRRLFTKLHHLYEDIDAAQRSAMGFNEWLLYALLHERPLISGVVRDFEASMDLMSCIDLTSFSRGQDHVVLFVVDNVESLIDLEAIGTAVSLLVRMKQLMGQRGRLVVASRPRSFYTSRTEIIPLPDAGHNLYETVQFSKYLRPIVIPDDDAGTARPFPDSLDELRNPATNPRYWEMLQLRLAYVVRNVGTVDTPVQTLVESVVEEVRRLFESAPHCSDLVSGLANHSFRSFLVSVVNFIEHYLRLSSHENTAKGEFDQMLIQQALSESFS
ncbi:MAG: hypothetical protein EON58_15395, partial [Alphaproteobacteria bacterium]